MIKFQLKLIARSLVDKLGGLSLHTTKELTTELVDRIGIKGAYYDVTINSLTQQFTTANKSPEANFAAIWRICDQKNVLKAQKELRDFISTELPLVYTQDDLNVIARVLTAYFFSE